MKTKWTTIQGTVLVAAIFCTLSASRAWAGPPLSTSTFTPAYPAGPSYDAAVASLPGLGLLPDGTDDRCSTNGERTSCWSPRPSTSLAGGVHLRGPPSWRQGNMLGALSVVALANEAAGIAKAQCDFQDGLIDGAEIEAAFENSKIIHADLGLHDDKLDAHDLEMQEQFIIQAKLDTLLSRQLEVIRLLHTPDGRRSSNCRRYRGALHLEFRLISRDIRTDPPRSVAGLERAHPAAPQAPLQECVGLRPRRPRVADDGSLLLVVVTKECRMTGMRALAFVLVGVIAMLLGVAARAQGIDDGTEDQLRR